MASTDPEGLRIGAGGGGAVCGGVGQGCPINGGRIPYTSPFPWYWMPSGRPMKYPDPENYRDPPNIAIGPPGCPKASNIPPSKSMPPAPRRKVYPPKIPRIPTTLPQDPTKNRCTLMFAFEPPPPLNCWFCWYMCTGAAPVMRWQPKGCHEDSENIEGWPDEIMGPDDIPLSGEELCNKNGNEIPLPIWNPRIKPEYYQ